MFVIRNIKHAHMSSSSHPTHRSMDQQAPRAAVAAAERARGATRTGRRARGPPRDRRAHGNTSTFGSSRRSQRASYKERFVWDFPPCGSAMDSHRAAELRAKRERLEQLRRAKAEAEGAHEARFGHLVRSGDMGGGAAARGKLPAELDELFAEALRQRIATEGSIDTMRQHIATGVVLSWFLC